eukprot:Lithocolla_globosa_v1_NODE_705_length_3413_cov_7.772186.p2 type:complete len:296 gc:universal NODE_705_length_3413_cov_7.772186:1619-732(-)
MYDHECSEECRKRGCGSSWTTDGLWKIHYGMCLWKVIREVFGEPLLNYPNVCTEYPTQGHVFCDHHIKAAIANSVPTEVQEFTKWVKRTVDEKAAQKKKDGPQTRSSKSKNTKDDDQVQQNESLEVNEKDLDKILMDMGERQSLNGKEGPATELLQGPDAMHFLNDCTEIPRLKSICKKDKGEKLNLRRRSLGWQAIVGGGGHIETIKPLYKSESSCQVFLILIQLLCAYVKVHDIPEKKWCDLGISYDDMCHLNSMKVAQLPLKIVEEKFQNLWLSVTKTIDGLLTAIMALHKR